MSEHNFFDLTRQNTGKDICDSGGESGRHWQQPPEKDTTPVVGWGDGGQGVIHTAKMLEETFNIEFRFNCWPQGLADAIWQIIPKLQWVESEGEYSYHGPKPTFDEDGDQLSEDEWSALEDWVKDHVNDHGMDSLDRIGEVTNTYNHESNLSQEVLYEVLSGPDYWPDNEDSVYLISTHNGADIRGGYSDTVLCTLKGTDRNRLLEPMVGYQHVGTLNGVHEEKGEYQTGYHSNPGYHLHNDLRWVGGKVTADGNFLTTEEFDKWVRETEDTSEGQILMVGNEISLDEGMAPPVDATTFVFELDTIV